MNKPTRVADPDKVERFAAERLGTIFSFVSDPLPLLTHRRLRQFSLFLLSGNPDERAISLIERGVKAQIKKYAGRASSRDLRTLTSRRILAIDPQTALTVGSHAIRRMVLQNEGSSSGTRVCEQLGVPVKDNSMPGGQLATLRHIDRDHS